MSFTEPHHTGLREKIASWAIRKHDLLTWEIRHFLRTHRNTIFTKSLLWAVEAVKNVWTVRILYITNFLWANLLCSTIFIRFPIQFPVTQVCSEDGMEFTLRTPEGFLGRIYTHGFYDRCFYRGNGGTANVLRISGAQGYPDCGTQRVIF